MYWMYSTEAQSIGFLQFNMGGHFELICLNCNGKIHYLHGYLYLKGIRLLHRPHVPAMTSVRFSFSDLQAGLQPVARELRQAWGMQVSGAIPIVLETPRCS